jgi:hypothetical protein
MSPSGADIDIQFNPQSIIEGFRKIDRARQEMEKGVAGAAEKWNKAFADFSQQIVTVSQRANRAQENYVRSIERQAAAYGKTGVEKLIAQRDQIIKRLGSEEELIKRVTAAYQKMIQVEEDADRKRKASGAGPSSLLFRGARDIFEGRMTYGAMDIGRAAGQVMGFGGAAGGGAGLAGISAATLAIGGFTAGLVGATVAGYKAAESMGEFGMRIHELQITTGMSAREVQQFSYAAKLTGHDAEDVDRMMRGLIKTMDGTGASAEKSRVVLGKYVKDVVGFRMGTVSLSEVLREMNAGLDQQSNAIQRDADMQLLFNRKASEAIGIIKDYNRAIEDTKNAKFFSDDDVQRMEETHLRIERLKLDVEEFFLHLKDWAGQKFVVVVDVVTKTGQATGVNLTPGASPVEMFAGAAAKLLGSTGVAGLFPPVAPAAPMYGPPPETPEQAAERNRIVGQQFAQTIGAPRGTGLEQAERTLSKLQEHYKSITENTTENLVKFKQNQDAYRRDIDETVAGIEKWKKTVEAIRKAESDGKSIAEELLRVHEQVADQLKSPYELPGEAQLTKFRERLAASGLSQPERAAALAEFRYGKPGQPGVQQLIDFQRTEQADKLQRQMLETQQTVTREMDRARLGGVQSVNIRELGQGGVTRADVERDINDQYKQRMDLAMETYQKEVELIKTRKIDARDTVALAQQQRDIVATTGKLATAEIEAQMAKKKEMHDLDEKERDQERRHREEMSKIQLADQEESIKHDADLARRRAELRFKGDSPAAGIEESYRIAVTEAHQLYDLEMQRIALFETGWEAERDRAEALKKLHREDAQAREESELKLAQMQQQQLDTLKGKIAPLYETLFTNPSKFGQQLRSTVTEAALHPIVSGMSEITSRALYPLIYGATGTGGIAGSFSSIFGGGRLNDVHLINGSVPVYVTGGGGGGYSSAGVYGYSPVGGYGYSPVGGGFSAAPWAYGPGGTSGFTGPVNLGGGGGDWTGGGGGGGGRGLNLSSFGGIGRNLISGWKQMLGFGAVHGATPGSESLARAAEGPGESAGGSFSWKGLGTSPLARAGAGTVGMMLAQQGLLGANRGTAGGVFEGMFGGAGVGFSMGGPLGAAIGAAAGLGIGLGEVIAGVESPRNEAKRLAHHLYHISVNNSTADQIVAIANQSYGGRVSVAVRSPEVRHMMGLYAAGTGQANQFAQSTMEPHGASLVESGGGLYQQATYQYGNAYSYGSNLPIYGGTPTHTLGGPGGNMSLSLNIGGQDAARFLQGNVVSPDVVQTQYASAMQGSSGRVGQALMMSEPGSIAS